MNDDAQQKRRMRSGRRTACGLLVGAALVLAKSGGAADELAAIAVEDAALSNQVAVAAQWRMPAEPGAGGDTLEIFLSNMSSNMLTFASATIENTGADAGIFWKQFYPTTNAAPGETIVCRLCFEKAPAPDREKGLSVAIGVAFGDGPPPGRSDPLSGLEPGRPRPAPSSLPNVASGTASLSVPLPPFRAPEKPITAISFSLDYDRVFIQCRSPNASLRKLWINGREIADYTCLQPPERGMPMVVACKTPLPLKTGDPVYVRLQFKDGLEAHALTRALSGIVRDAYLIPAKERINVVARLALDADPPLAEFGVSSWFGDPACYDITTNQHGAAVVGILADRPRLYREQPGKLTYLHYCTASYTAIWNIYGTVADMAWASPYGLSHGHGVARFLDKEEQAMEQCRRSGYPAAWGWIPDTFRRKPRFIEPDEMRTLVWVALVKGCKAIKYFAYHLDDPKQDGFDKCPILADTIADVNKTIALKQARLAPLIPVSERIEGDPAGSGTGPKTGVKVYTAWSGDRGMLALLRNLDYTTDDQANDGGHAPRFKVNTKTNVTVTLSVPNWLRHDGVRDFMSDEKISSAMESKGLAVTIPQLDVFKVLWLENTAPAIAAHVPSGTSAVAPAVSAGSGQVVKVGVGAPPPRTADGKTPDNRLLVLCALGVGVLLVAVWVMRKRK